MNYTSVFTLRGSMILWPSLFVPSVLESGEQPRYRASFTIPEGVEVPADAFVKTLEGRYGLPIGTRVVNCSGFKPFPIFGVEETMIVAAANTMQRVDSLLHGAQCDVTIGLVLTKRGSFFAEAVAIKIVAPLALPDFETLTERAM